MHALTGFLTTPAAAPALSLDGQYLAQCEELAAHHDAERAAMPTDANLHLLEQLLQAPTTGMDAATFYRREVELHDALVLTYGFSDIEATDYLRFCRSHPLRLPPEVSASSTLKERDPCV